MEFLFMIVAIAVVLFIKKKDDKDYKAAKEYTEQLHREQSAQDDRGGESYIGKYKSRMLLTKNEYAAYKKLKPIADAHGLLICPKVRLIDIVEPKTGDQQNALRAKVIQKHVDFVICNSDLKILGVLELDDSSHDTQKRIDRDQFVDEILTDVGYTVIHARYINEDTLNPIIKKSTT